ncbi:MAG: pyruvate kinase [Candidatus Dormibacteria bacterium]
MMLRRTRIVCTLGPACDRDGVLDAMVTAGMNVARLNFSHGTAEQNLERGERARSAAARQGRPLALMMDLQGPRLRVGDLPGGSIDLVPDAELLLNTGAGGAGIPAGYPGLEHDLRVDEALLLDEGRLELRVLSTGPGQVRCRVVRGGRLLSRKAINAPDSELSLPSITDKDRADLAQGLASGIDLVALSFVGSAADVAVARELCGEGPDAPLLVAKLERARAVTNLEEIAQTADAIMVARGDLGVELPPQAVPGVQKDALMLANSLRRPAITATQMLESMVDSPRPTRAEASDVANAIWDGTDAVMLSQETAVGNYPVEAVAMMAAIAQAAEARAEFVRAPSRVSHEHGMTESVAAAAASLAADVGAAAIVAFTETGSTPRFVSKQRPPCPILAATATRSTYRRMALLWGVTPITAPRAADTDAMIASLEQVALESGLIQVGDLLVITAGVPVGTPGSTNLVKVHRVGTGVSAGG